MKEINFPKVTGLTSPNPLTLVCTKKEDGTTTVGSLLTDRPHSLRHFHACPTLH